MEDTSQPLRRSSRKRTLRTTLQQEYQSEAVGETNATSKGTGKRVKKHKHIAAKGVPGINASEAVHNPNVEAECITGSGKVILSDFSEDHLLQQVLSNGTSLKVTLIQLEKTLKSVNSNLSAKKSIVEFLFHSCGCHTSVTEKEISSMSEIPTIVNRIAESITLLADEYPIVSKNKDLRKFSQRYSELWSMLPLTFSEDILINQGLLDFVFSWLNYMSTAPRLSFRHTACVAIFNLMSGIIKLSSQLKNRVELAGKITKSKRKKAADNDQIDSLKERIKSLDHISNSCFDKVFPNRFRDIYPCVRQVAIRSFAEWVQIDDSFLVPEKVKYLGWALNDQDPGVRKASIESLHACYSLWSDSPTLLVFHQKFSRRILELTRDIDSTVVAASLDLITAILTNTELELDDDSLDQLPRLLWDASPSVRNAVARHIYETAFSGGSEDSEEHHYLIDLKSLLSLYQESCPDIISDELGSVGIFIDSLIEFIPALHSWNDYLSLLQSETEISEEQHILLLKFLVEAAKCLSSSLENSRLSKNKRRLFNDVRSSFDLIMIDRLDTLLEMCQANEHEATVAITLLRLVSQAELVKQSERQSFVSLMSIIKKCFLTHSSLEFLYECSQTLSIFCKTAGTLKELTEQIIQEISDSFMNNLFLGNQDESCVEFDPQFICISTRRFLSLISNIRVRSLRSHSTELIQLMHFILLKESSSSFHSESIRNLISGMWTLFLWEIKDYSVLNEQENYSEINRSLFSEIDAFMEFLSKAMDKLTTVGDLSFSVWIDCTLLVSKLSHVDVHISSAQGNVSCSYFVSRTCELSKSSYVSDIQAGSLLTKEQSDFSKSLLLIFGAAARAILGSFENFNGLTVGFLRAIGTFGSEIDAIIKHCILKLKTLHAKDLLQVQFQAVKETWENESPERTKDIALKFAQLFLFDSNSRYFPIFVKLSIEYSLEIEENSNSFLQSVLPPFIQRAIPEALAEIKRTIEFFESKEGISQILVVSLRSVKDLVIKRLHNKRNGPNPS